jgi:hypothetical protein
MKMHMEKIHTFLNSELDAGEWLASCLAIKVSHRIVNLFHQARCTPQVTETGGTNFNLNQVTT